MITDLFTQLNAEELLAGLDHIRSSPKNEGVLDLIVRRQAINDREVVEQAELDLVEGLVGDTWNRRRSTSTPDGSPNVLMQVTVMNSRVAALVAQHRDRWPLAGDQFYIDMDLSAANLPAGARLALGSAINRSNRATASGLSKVRRAVWHGSHEVRQFTSRQRAAAAGNSRARHRAGYRSHGRCGAQD